LYFSKSKRRARGSINEEVTAYRTIATDKTIFPPGCLTFLSTVLPVERGGVITDSSYAGFALDQDTGGAIRAPGRCDVYIGTRATRPAHLRQNISGRKTVLPVCKT
jgi:membrane-bound lytic murein transglycosylase A